MLLLARLTDMCAVVRLPTAELERPQAAAAGRHVYLAQSQSSAGAKSEGPAARSVLADTLALHSTGSGRFYAPVSRASCVRIVCALGLVVGQQASKSTLKSDQPSTAAPIDLGRRAAEQLC